MSQVQPCVAFVRESHLPCLGCQGRRWAYRPNHSGQSARQAYRVTCADCGRFVGYAPAKCADEAMGQGRLA